MGIQALKSHCKGAQHLKLTATICNVKAITSLTTSSQDITEPDSTAKVSEVPTCSKKETWEKSPSIDSYLLKDDVTKAEIRWCMRTIMKQSSYNSCEKLKDLFCDMFPDSKIAVSIDEVFNSVSNLKQLDVHLVYFDQHLQRTQTVFQF